mmetsp:Transcript_14405/g.30415  ORF Transcript_14405/g.30415 Transcript_14405/m.30415 type:complete len:228 (+) Transcript_14405:115-798(+)
MHMAVRAADVRKQLCAQSATGSHSGGRESSKWALKAQRLDYLQKGASSSTCAATTPYALQLGLQTSESDKLSLAHKEVYCGCCTGKISACLWFLNTVRASHYNPQRIASALVFAPPRCQETGYELRAGADVGAVPALCSSYPPSEVGKRMCEGVNVVVDGLPASSAQLPFATPCGAAGKLPSPIKNGGTCDEGVTACVPLLGATSSRSGGGSLVVGHGATLPLAPKP